MMKTHPNLEPLAMELLRTVSETYPASSVHYGFEDLYANLSYPTRAEIDRTYRALSSLSARVADCPGELDELDKLDQELLGICSELLRFELRVPAHEEANISPAGLVLRGVHSILELTRLTSEEKARCVLARLERAPDLFSSLRATWERASHLW